MILLIRANRVIALQFGKISKKKKTLFLFKLTDFQFYSGTIERRWTSFQSDGPRPTAIVTMRAISLTKEQNHLTVNIKHLSEQMFLMQLDWADQLEKFSELGLRDLILDSICPDIYGMYPVKLAIALAICSGNNDEVDGKNSDRLHQRGQSHVLLIGDPGLAKSKLLLSAVSIAPRAVHTTGMGCSSAGLTAAAVKVKKFI